MIDDAVCRVLNFILMDRRYGANPAPRSQKYVPSKNTTNQNKNKIKKRNICIQPTLCLLFKRYLLSVSIFVFCLLSLPISDSSIRSFRQRVTSQHTVNANELGTKALQGLC